MFCQAIHYDVIVTFTRRPRPEEEMEILTVAERDNLPPAPEKPLTFELSR